MSSETAVQKGRRGFFMAMALGVSDAVVGAANAVGAIAPAAPTANDHKAREPEPAPRKRNVRPAAIPGVRA